MPAPENQNEKNFFEETELGGESEPMAGRALRLRLFFSNLFLAALFRKRLLILVGGGLLTFILTVTVLNKWVTPRILNSNFGGLTPLAVDEIQIDSVQVLPRTDDTAVAVVHLRNTNKSFGLAKLDYAWQATAPAGLQLSGQGQTYIMPEQDKFLVIPILGGQPGQVALSLPPHLNGFVRPHLRPDVQLQAVNVQWQNTDDGFLVTGQVSNNTPYVFYRYDLTVLVRDRDGQIVAALATGRDRIEPGDFQLFRLLWPKTLPEAVLADVRPLLNRASRLDFDLYLPEEAIR